MDRFKAMQVLRRVVEVGNMTAAAQDMNLGQASVSRVVAELERRLGVQLLHRGPPVVPTEAGRRFYEKAADILLQVEELEDSLRVEGGEARGIVRVACSAAFCHWALLPALPRFKAAYPNIVVEVRVEETPADLVAGGVDLAIRPGPLEDGALIARKIGHVQTGLFASEDFIRRHGVPAQPEDLARFDCCVLSSARSEACLALLGPGGLRVEAPLRVGFYASGIEALRLAALNGLGITQLPVSMGGEGLFHAPDERLRRILPAWRTPAREMFVVWPTTQKLPQRVRAFVDFVVAMVPISRNSVEISGDPEIPGVASKFRIRHFGHSEAFW